LELRWSVGQREVKSFGRSVRQWEAAELTALSANSCVSSIMHILFVLPADLRLKSSCLDVHRDLKIMAKSSGSKWVKHLGFLCTRQGSL